MSLKAVLENTEGLSEEVAGHYVEKDGKFFLGVESVDGLELSDPRGLKSALSKEKENASKAKKELAAFADIDPVKAREALSKIDEIANWTPDTHAKELQELFEKRLTDKLDGERKQQITKFESEQKALQDRNGILEKQLHNTMIDMAATKAISDANGIHELLMHKVTSAMQIREEEGKFSTVILDAEGNPQMSSEPGEYQKLMTVDQFVAKLKSNEVLAPAFKGTGASGSGARSSNSVSGTGAHTITAEQASDFQTYKRMKAAAEKAGVELRPV